MLLSAEKPNRGCCMSQSDSRSAAANHLSDAVIVLAVLYGGVCCLLALLGPPCTSRSDLCGEKSSLHPPLTPVTEGESWQ